MKIKNKKGITLIELIIACVVMVLIFAAAAGALKISLDNYKNSNIVSNNLQNATLLEEYLKGAFSTAENITITKNLPAVPTDKEQIYFHFNSENDVIVVKRKDDGSEEQLAALKGIEAIKLEIAETGKSNSRKLVAKYEVVLPYDVDQESIVTGSVILKNSTKTAIPSPESEKISAYHPDPSSGATSPPPHPFKYLTATLQKPTSPPTT